MRPFYDIPKTVVLLNNSFSRTILFQRFSYGIYRSRSPHVMLAPAKEKRHFSEWLVLSFYRLNIGKDRNILYRRLDGPRSRYERALKILPPPGIDPRIPQRVAICYKAYANPAAYSIYKIREYSRIILRGTVFQHKMSLFAIDSCHDLLESYRLRMKSITSIIYILRSILVNLKIKFSCHQHYEKIKYENDQSDATV